VLWRALVLLSLAERPADFVGQVLRVRVPSVTRALPFPASAASSCRTPNLSVGAMYDPPMVLGEGFRGTLLAGVLAALLCGGAGCGQRSLASGKPNDGGGSCGDAFAPPTPLPAMPTTPGCYEGVDGGWIPVLCLCELPIDNTATSPGTFTITLGMTKASPAPSLAGSLDVEVSFDDPDASWYLVWAKQPASGTDYLVTNAGGKTTVQLGVTSLVLAPVPLSACGARMGTATIFGTYDASWSTLSLDMTASIDVGGVPTTTATCPAPVPQ